MDVVRHKHVLLQVTESLTGAAERWAWEERQRKERNRRRPFDLEAEKVYQTGKQELLQADLLPSRKQAQSSLVEEPQVQEGGSQAGPGVETFQDVFMVSALTGDGIDDLRVILLPLYILTSFSLEIIPIVGRSNWVVTTTKITELKLDFVWPLSFCISSRS